MTQGVCSLMPPLQTGVDEAGFPHVFPGKDLVSLPLSSAPSASGWECSVCTQQALLLLERCSALPPWALVGENPWSSPAAIHAQGKGSLALQMRDA